MAILATIDRATALRELALEHQAVRALIAALTPDEMQRPDTIEYGLYWDQQLSFKDLLAHLITYEAYTLEAVDAWQRGGLHPVVDQMRTAEGGRRIHYDGIAARSAHALEAVLEESRRTQDALTATLSDLSEADWAAPPLFSTALPTNLGGVIETILVAPPRPPYRHLPVHIPDTDAYIGKLRRGSA